MTATAGVTESAPDHYVMSFSAPEINLRFNHYLVKDDEPASMLIPFSPGAQREGYFEALPRRPRAVHSSTTNGGTS